MTDRNTPADPSDPERSDDLSSSDDAFVRDLLGHLEPVTMPPDVVARLNAALVAVAADPDAFPADTLTSDLSFDRAQAGTIPQSATGDTVVPLASRRRRMDLRYVSVAAAAVLVLGGGWAILHQRTHNDTVASTASGAVSPAAAVVVKQSGTAYHATSLPTQVRSLVSGTPTAGTASAPATSSVGTSPNTAGSSTPVPTGSAAVDAALTSLLGDQDALNACFAAVLDGADPSVKPIAADAGTYEGKPALVIVLPGTKADKLDVFVVEPPAASRRTPI